MNFDQARQLAVNSVAGMNGLPGLRGCAKVI